MTASPGRRSRSASSVASSTSSNAPATFDDLVPQRAPTTTDASETIVPVDGVPDGVIGLKVDAGPGCGGIAWSAGEVLSRYLAYRHSLDPAILAGRTVLELGSGTGLVGLVAKLLEASADVWVTDQAPLLQLMRVNAALNRADVHVAEYNWGEPANVPAPSLVLAADCVYFEPAFPLLVSTLCDLAPAGSDVEILFCWKKRRKADKRFFAMLKKHFISEDITDDRPGERDRYNREGVTLSRVRRR
ncbi:Protein-lysine N-methyltransferase efm6 [Cryptotrichosporon argae]